MSEETRDYIAANAQGLTTFEVKMTYDFWSAGMLKYMVVSEN